MLQRNQKPHMLNNAEENSSSGHPWYTDLHKAHFLLSFLVRAGLLTGPFSPVREPS